MQGVRAKLFPTAGSTLSTFSVRDGRRPPLPALADLRESISRPPAPATGAVHRGVPERPGVRGPVPGGLTAYNAQQVRTVCRNIGSNRFDFGVWPDSGDAEIGTKRRGISELPS